MFKMRCKILIEQFLQNYKNRFILLKKRSRELNSVFSISLLNGIGISYLISWKLAFYSWLYLGELELSPITWELLTYPPFMYMVLISLTLLDKITLGVIHINSWGQKIIFNLMQRFDVWYFLKYRRQGPLTETVFRLQQNLISLDPLTKRRILVATIAIVAVYYCLKIEVI